MSAGATTTEAQRAVRHEWIDALCARLERMILADAADALLAAGEPAVDSYLVAPVWLWRPARIDIGRKARRADGATMLMPVRVTWGPSPLVRLGPGEIAEMTWSLSGLGHDGAGQVVLRARSDGTLQVVSGQAPDGQLPRLVSRIDDLSGDGKAARWEALMSLEGYVEKAVVRAICVVKADVLADDAAASSLIDDNSRDQVRDRMLLGDEQTVAPVIRLLERCKAPQVFAGVDPLRYVTVDLQRTAESEVRRAINDVPKVGRKVRLLRRAMPEATLDEFLAEYRRNHPGDSLSWRRAVRALSTCGDPMAGHWRVDTFDPADEYDLADQVADHLDRADAVGAA